MEGAHNRKVFHLVERRRSDATVSKLAGLLLEAERGRPDRQDHLIGIAFVAWYGDRKYSVDVVGELRRDPERARGVLSMLEAQLRQLIEESLEQD